MDKQSLQNQLASSVSSSSARVTRSAARLNTASTSASPASSAPPPPPHPPPTPPPPPPLLPPTSLHTQLTNHRKRKAIAREISPETQRTTSPETISKRRSKRSKTESEDLSTVKRSGGQHSNVMSSNTSNSGPVDDTIDTSQPSSRKKSTRKKSTNHESTIASASSSTPTAKPSRKSKSTSSRRKSQSENATNKDEDKDKIKVKDKDKDRDTEKDKEKDSDDSDDSDISKNEPSFDDGDPLRSWGDDSRSSRFETAMRNIHSAISRTMVDLRGLLEQLKVRDDPTTLRFALEELAGILLMANEDTLAGHFSPEPYLKELIPIMNGEENSMQYPEIMLMACRCLANMMEALPASTSSIVYCGAVPILCEKLRSIEYIDLAEQALSTLEKISIEFPGAIVRAAGLEACLQYLDFFPISIQRSAVTTAANCCRNLNGEHFNVIKEVMPILINVLSNSDQKVLEQGCLCVSRIVESFRFHDSKLEELASEELLQKILQLLLPGTTNMINTKIHTSFLRVLAFTARASPKLSVALIKMNVVDTLFQILSGISPPNGDEYLSSKIDKVMIMQSLIHKPRDQIFETLNVICELLPSLSPDGLHYLDGLYDAGFPGPEVISITKKTSVIQSRTKLLDECQPQLRRFIVILLPTLTEAYSSTVNLSVRQKVLTSQLKMLSNINLDILQEALIGVSYPSFLASIFSQNDDPTLVSFALQAVEVILHRLEAVYRYQFYREGVFSAIAKLAERPLKTPDAIDVSKEPLALPSINFQHSINHIPKSEPEPGPGPELEPEHEPELDTAHSSMSDIIGDMEMEFHDGQQDDEMIEVEDDDDGEDDDEDDDDRENDREDEDADDIENEEENEDHEDVHDDDFDGENIDYDHTGETTDSDDDTPPPRIPNFPQNHPEDFITKRAKAFVEQYDSNPNDDMRVKAANKLQSLQGLASNLCSFKSNAPTNPFVELATFFTKDELSNITSFELIHSNVVDALLEVLSGKKLYDSGELSSMHISQARGAFLEAFMQYNSNNSTDTISETSFSVIVHKLQDLLSRSEHFEVMTAHHGAHDTGRGSPANLLAKSIRIRLQAEENSDITGPLRDTIITVHALSTIRAIGDFLRPRLSLPDRTSRFRREPPGDIAAFAAALAAHRGGGFPFAGHLPSSSRSGRSKRSKPSGSNTLTDQNTPSIAGASSSISSGLRRSRRHQDHPPAVNDELPIKTGTDENKETIECADEKKLLDDDLGDEEPALNTLIPPIVPTSKNNEDNEEDDPSAVNLEIAPGGKVTAMKEDGTRVATPTQTPTQTPNSNRSASRNLTASLRNPTSLPHQNLLYAAALASSSNSPSNSPDFHLQFSINGQDIGPDTTMYRVIHFSDSIPNQLPTSRGILSNTHTIKFRKVNGPAPPPSLSLNHTMNIERPIKDGIPSSLADNPKTATILQTLSILHEINYNIDDVLSEKHDHTTLTAEPLSHFVNTKLTAKLNRQLEEPLIVASGCLPIWSEDLARHYPFLFPFETRHLFLQSTSFGFARSMNRWQHEQNHESRLRDDHRFLGRLQRQKVRISRSKILESALKVMDLYGGSPAILEVEFFDEVGTGLGPTLEFYSSASKEFAKKKLKLWRENESDSNSLYAFGSRGLFPAPMNDQMIISDNGQKVLTLFKTLGKFVARSMLDSRIVDINFNPVFFRIANNTKFTPTLAAADMVDSGLGRSLKQLKKAVVEKKKIESSSTLTQKEKTRSISEIQVNGATIEDLSLDFTLPGYSNIELVPNGANIDVTINNLAEYIDKVLDLTLGRGIESQISAFQAGFSLVFPYVAIHAFTPAELVMMYGQVDEDWSIQTLLDSIKADHGYNLESKSVHNLLSIMSSMTTQERRDFLQFVTGSPKLPIGGFKSLTPMFTVVCKQSEDGLSPDCYLPSVMTCVNYLKMPNYSTLEIMNKRLKVAVKEGQGAFHLS